MPFSYEDYDKKASTYTSMRRAIGWEREVKFFEGNTKVPISEQILLDAGCGTGNYMVQFIKAGAFKHLHCSDFNGAMTREAENNWKNQCNSAGSVQFSNDDIANLKDMKDDFFDAVCNNQVVHHLRGDNDFEDLRQAAKEFFRVLKVGGRVCINWSPPENAAAGMWWSELIPKAMKKWNPRSPDEAKMREILTAAGFTKIRCEPLLEEFLYDPELYLNPENFLDIENFRRSDSTFNLVTDEELQAAVARVYNMQMQGTLQAWFQQREQARLARGQTVTVFAEKTDPAAPLSPGGAGAGGC